MSSTASRFSGPAAKYEAAGGCVQIAHGDPYTSQAERTVRVRFAQLNDRCVFRSAPCSKGLVVFDKVRRPPGNTNPPDRQAGVSMP